jgi:hypothetical protein
VGPANENVKKKFIFQSFYWISSKPFKIKLRDSNCEEIELLSKIPPKIILKNYEIHGSQKHEIQREIAKKIDFFLKLISANGSRLSFQIFTTATLFPVPVMV